MKKLFLAVLLLPFVTFAQTEGELTIGGMSVQYDSRDETGEGIYYFQGESLVASEHEGISLVFKKDEVVLEAYDTDEDGEVDTYIKLASTGEEERVEGLNVSEFERPETVEFTELLEREHEIKDETSDEDLVGSLDSITIPRYHNYGFYVFVVVFLVATYWWYKRRSNKKED